jgi:Ca2+-binding EF-hand superfamily protein
MKASRLLMAGAIAALLPIAVAFAQSPAPPESTQPAQSSQQGATFESLDKDSDGRISKTEASVNANVTSQFSRYDKNGNGFIERDEVTVANTSPSDNSPKQ